MKLKQEASVQAQDEIEGENKESANSFEHFDTWETFICWHFHS